MYTINPKIKEEIFDLLVSTDFDVKRIVIADQELTDAALVLRIEDKENPKGRLDECIELPIAINELIAFISKNNHNTYEWFSKSRGGRMFKDRVMINEPLAFYIQDASVVHQGWIREEILEELLKELLAAVTHG